MQTAPQIRPYPWQALDTLAREAAFMLRDARHAVRRAVDEGKVAQALGELVGEHVSMLVHDIVVVTEDSVPVHGASITLTTASDDLRIQLDFERDLARILVGRMIGRPIKLGDPMAPLAPEIEGGLLAIACSVARRAHGSGGALLPLGAGGLRLSPGERRFRIDATVLIGPDAYPVRATVQLRRAVVTTSASSAEDLSALGALPISLGVVGAVSVARASEVNEMTAGDVWMPSSGWSLQRASAAPGAKAKSPLVGEVILTAPGAERGLRGRLGENGEIVVLGVTNVPNDVEAKPMAEKQDDSTATSEVVLEAPLVVRVEIGAVTMAAREWAGLKPGDVIGLARRVSEPVVLRIGGIEVARGELVDIEGEVGVRIREQVKTS